MVTNERRWLHMVVASLVGVAASVVLFVFLGPAWLMKIRHYAWRFRPILWGTMFILFVLWGQRFRRRRPGVWSDLGDGSFVGYLSGVIAYLGVAALDRNSGWGNVSWVHIVTVIAVAPLASLSWVQGGIAAVVAGRCLDWGRSSR